MPDGGPNGSCYALKITYELEWGDPKKPKAPRHFEGFGLTRLGPDGEPEWTGVIRLDPARLRQPCRHPQPSMIFGNSMYDIFHEDMPPFWIQKIFDVCRDADWHHFIFLTKRSKHMLKLDRAGLIDWPKNVIMGVSIESNDYVRRADHIRAVGAAKKLISYEPALDSVSKLDTSGIDWLIAGGQSGPGYRKMKLEWVEEALHLCRASGTAFFCKQDSSRKDGTKGRFKHRPDLWIQEWPMPTDKNDPLYKFYMTTRGRAAVMQKILKKKGW